MSTFLIIFLIWFPVSSIFYSLVKGGEDSSLSNNYAKKVLFWMLTLPSIWFFELNRFAGRVLSKFSFFSKVATWFKK